MATKPGIGDLIEIYRWFAYQHWAVYVGDGYVVHLASAFERADAGFSSLKTIEQDKAIVMREKLEDVVRKNEYHVNNLLDEHLKPRPIKDILQDAQSLVGQRLPYNLITKNCEHFVTKLRYGTPQSRQLKTAAKTAVGAAADYAVRALYFLIEHLESINNNQDNKKQTQ